MINTAVGGLLTRCCSQSVYKSFSLKRFKKDDYNINISLEINLVITMTLSFFKKGIFSICYQMMKESKL